MKLCCLLCRVLAQSPSITRWTLISWIILHADSRGAGRLVMNIRVGSSYLLFLVATLVGGTWAQDNNKTQLKAQNISNQGVYNLSELEAEERTLEPPKVRHPRPAYAKVECTTLRSKRYISDGFCTSVRPITEVICTGVCVPMDTASWYIEFIKVLPMDKLSEYRCVNDVVKRKKVRLLCENGETRTYKIKVVKSCKCKNKRTWRKSRKRRRKDKEKSNSSNPPKP